jgi:hypothetical protein
MILPVPFSMHCYVMLQKVLLCYCTEYCHKLFCAVDLLYSSVQY